MHVIRLRAPWEILALAQPPGLVRCTRHFNQPTGLGGGERVWLVVDGAVCPEKVALNGEFVGSASGLSPSGTARLDITPLLAPRNKIEIELAAVEGVDPLDALGDVRLEIEEADARRSSD
ncbi:MAG: hypothetical protein L0211_21280 [Planctomycetaceae bacterium]|nr:hypothetical protein [Planctomycetaceae bacterium]